MNKRENNIIEYFYKNGIKMYDINQALKDGGWPEINKENYKYLHLIDRKTGEQAIVKEITGTQQMYFVRFIGGGFLCLDHAIEQYKISQNPENLT